MGNKSIKENYFFGYPDDNKGRGYGRLGSDAEYMPISADGFPYDIHEPLDDCGDNCGEEEFDDPLLQKQFAGKMGAYAQSKPDYVSRPGDPFSYFDDATVGLAEDVIREYVNLFLELNRSAGAGMAVRMHPRSSETDGAVTQWGTRIPGGTQFGWSSAYPFPQKKEPYEPVFSLRDLMTKHEDEWDRTHGDLEPEPDQEWKEAHGEEEWNKNNPLFWE